MNSTLSWSVNFVKVEWFFYMFKIFYRYLAFSFIPPFSLSIIFFVVFLLTFQLFRITSMIIGKDVNLMMVLELMGHISITFIPIAAPLSAIFATIFTLNKLSEDSEIIAMKSFGMNKFKLFLPFVLLGSILAITVFSLNKNLIPYSKIQFREGIVKLTSKGLLKDIKKENFFTDIPGITLFAENVEEDGTKLENVFIHLNRGNDHSEKEKIIMAEKGRVIKIKDNKWGASSMRLNLINGNILKFADMGKVEKILFKEYNFPMFDNVYRSNAVVKNSMLTNDELKNKIKKNNKSGKINSEGNIKAKLEYYSRFNTPFLIITFIMLGFSLGIKRGRAAQGNPTAVSMIIIICYYVMFFVFLSMAKEKLVIPEIAVYFPTFLAFAIASYLFSKLDWLS